MEQLPEELAKAARGELYDANYDPETLKLRQDCKAKLWEYNNLHPHKTDERTAILKNLIGKTGKAVWIEPPFLCDYGFNIELGENFYANYNLVILDATKVTIGSNCFIAPNVGIYTAGHPLDAARRNAGLEYALPVTIGDNVWIGAGVHILPGAIIGDNCVIGAGSVVTRGTIPPNMVAAGNPCRVIREITEEDAKREKFS
ncbi:bacterial transferase hexapeptide (six repeats) domain-containing protein [Ditylenchus destructor]|uniref:Bacterial transferase hexapeptide (Six repeats) domain-containing protein n=1 Tax=Ditylenchus destructor TaxID=166010 RepID=A0AAD4MPF7_9BILA|nr:bacterial transferase hexapeptide (six repeats) domain-containing protein [Ditylenchus destructor]